MAFQLKVTSGATLGQILDIHHDQVIGRGHADIVLNDSKVSGQHAKIESLPSGGWVIRDLGSRNGLLVNGALVSEVALAPGVIFQIGNTHFEVLPAQQTAPKPPPTAKKSESPAQTPPLQSFDYLADFSNRSVSKVKNRPSSLLPFVPLLRLRVTHGPHAGTDWMLGYGPRIVGSGSTDLVLLDGPEVAFTVAPAEGAAAFLTDHPQQVTLNGRALSSETLKDGDVIRFSETQIKVSFKE
jgi:pSer/pThr/pTyr-binding forkhead associated (FHA) protein